MRERGQTFTCHITDYWQYEIKCLHWPATIAIIARETLQTLAKSQCGIWVCNLPLDTICPTLLKFLYCTHSAHHNNWFWPKATNYNNNIRYSLGGQAIRHKNRILAITLVHICVLYICIYILWQWA